MGNLQPPTTITHPAEFRGGDLFVTVRGEFRPFVCYGGLEHYGALPQGHSPGRKYTLQVSEHKFPGAREVRRTGSAQVYVNGRERRGLFYDLFEELAPCNRVTWMKLEHVTG